VIPGTLHKVEPRKIAKGDHGVKTPPKSQLEPCMNNTEKAKAKIGGVEPEKKLKTKKIKIVFMGTPAISVPILETLYKSPYFEIAVVISSPLPSPIKQFAQKNNLKISQPEKIIQIKNELKKLKADIAVVTAYGQIIPAEVLALFEFGIVNVHFSLLPKWRGASPIQYSLMAGDKITGTSLMVMDKKMDTGPILAQKEIKIEPDNDFSTLAQKLTKISTEILEKTILDYISGKIKPVPQDNSKATYTKLFKKEDGLLDFKKPASELENQIKAFSVWPKSYTFWNNKRIIIKKAYSTETEPKPPAAAGTVFLDKKSKKLAILTGKGSLIVDKIQLEGKKELNSKEFLNGHPEIIGSVLKSKFE